MKKLLIILTLSLFTGFNAFSQEEETPAEGYEKIRDKMSEYIQKRLHLSKAESEKFSPVFLRYFKEWRTTIRENRGDRLVLQQKIVDLRLRYRSEFRDILGEKRGGQVFDHQEIFIREIKELGKRRLEREGGGGVRRNKAMMPL